MTDSVTAVLIGRSSRYDWLLAVLGLGVAGGAYLDGWAHHHDRVDDSFFTLWHAVLYGSVGLLGVVLALTARRNWTRGSRWRSSLPPGYLPSLLGVLLFAGAGLGDLAWHTLFGVEDGVESLVSPTHLLLAVAAVLIVSGPLRAVLLRDAGAEAWTAAGPAVLSMTVVVALLMFMTQYAHPLAEPVATERDGPEPLADLYVMAQDGTDQRRLTTDLGEWNGFAAWSPDTTMLVFAAGTPPAPSDLYVLSLAHGDRRRLTETPEGEFSPSWSPDGARIAFAARADGGTTEVCTVAAAGGDRRCITQTRAEKWGPKWSPDGRQIAFASRESGSWQVHLMDADGGRSVQLTAAAGTNSAPAWSPDGRTLAFHSTRDGTARIYVMASDGSGQHAITSAGLTAFVPSWSHDGAAVAFTSEQDGAVEIFVVDTAVGEPRNLTRNAALASSLPAWSPDGRYIAFTGTASRQGGAGRELRDAYGMAAIVIQTLLLIAPILFLLQRGLLPVGATAVLLTVPSAFVVVLEDHYELLPWSLAAGIAAELLLAALRRSRALPLALYSFAVPVLFWSAYFAGLAMSEGVAWSVHLWVGSIALSELVGLLASLIAAPSRMPAIMNNGDSA